jgi:hypothetical protein
VDAADAAARRLGYEIVHPLTDEPWGVRRFFVREPSGKVVNVPSHPELDPTSAPTAAGGPPWGAGGVAPHRVTKFDF